MSRKRNKTADDFCFSREHCYCSRCCESQPYTCTYPMDHAVIFIDTGTGMEWLCSACFDEWIDGLLNPQSPVALVDGATVTLDGILFEF